MANHCYNFIHTDNQKVINVFRRLEKKCNKSNEGQTLTYFKDDRYLFDIYVDGSQINCWTKWGPPMETIINLAKKYDCVIEMDYDESGNLIYGQIIADKYGWEDVFLTDKDWDKVDYNEELDKYLFEGEYYDSDQEIKDILLERRIDA